MRGWILISVLALAGCGEHAGVNPNYQFGTSPYGQYLTQREQVLTTNGKSPAVIPLARPFKAPTAEQIAGRSSTPPTAVAAAPTATRARGTTPLMANDGPYPGSMPVLARFAAETQHAPGTATYTRKSGSDIRASRACAGFQNPEAAQISFLAAGGPQADPRGMDPDGDGFVCGWDPRPLRLQL